MLQDFLFNTPKKHIIFDLDETITHLHIDWMGFRDGLYDRVLQFDAQLVKEVPNKSGSANDLYNAVIRKHGFAGKKVVDSWCLHWELEKYGGHNPNEQLVDYIKNAKMILSIWTANNHKMATKVLKELDILSCFSKIVAKEDCNCSKPYPDGFYTIYNSQVDSRDDFLMIGNSTHDYQAAIAAGIDFFWVQDCF